MLVLTENDAVSVFLAKELYSPLFPMKYALKHTQNGQHFADIFLLQYYFAICLCQCDYNLDKSHLDKWGGSVVRTCLFFVIFSNIFQL